VDNLVLTHGGGRIISSGNRDNIIKVWDLFEKRFLFEFNQDLTDHGVTSDWVSAIAITSDDQSLVSGSVDGSICIWDLEERILKHTILRAHDGKNENFDNLSLDHRSGYHSKYENLDLWLP
jgi:WD40 repeat protein